MADHGSAEGGYDILAAYILMKVPRAGIGLFVNEHCHSDWCKRALE
jgi:hypothetical protein